MKVHVKHSLKADAEAVFKLCTEQKHQEAIYAKLGGTDLKVKREGRAPNVRLAISRREPANAPPALARFVPSVNDVSHTEQWAADGDGYSAKLAVDIKGVPVKIGGTKSIQPAKGGCTIEWTMDVTSGIPLLGGTIAAFAGQEIEAKLQAEYKLLKAMA